MTEELPELPLDELLRVVRLYVSQRVEAHREFDDGDRLWLVEIFGLPAEGWQAPCRRVSEALLEHCQDNGWMPSFHVIPARQRAQHGRQG